MYEKGRFRKKVYDIVDIKNDLDKTQQLFNGQKWDELREYLGKMQMKYISEIFVYNQANRVPPRNLQENAMNCMDFLSQLAIAKMIESIKDY